MLGMYGIENSQRSEKRPPIGQGKKCQNMDFRGSFLFLLHFRAVFAPVRLSFFSFGFPFFLISGFWPFSTPYKPGMIIADCFLPRVGAALILVTFPTTLSLQACSCARCHVMFMSLAPSIHASETGTRSPNAELTAARALLGCDCTWCCSWSWHKTWRKAAGHLCN